MLTSELVGILGVSIEDRFWFTGPVFYGDTITIDVWIAERLPESRTLVWEASARNEEGREVLKASATLEISRARNRNGKSDAAPGMQKEVAASSRGVVVATVLPFTKDGAIDWAGYGAMLDYCAKPDGISAVFVNGHAGEGATLSAGRARGGHRAHARAYRIQDRCSPASSLIPSAEAIAQAREAQAAGADCAVLFPLAGPWRGRVGDAARAARLTSRR